MKEPTVLKALAALSQANRLRVFRNLVVAGKSGSTPTVIAKRMKVSPATLSFHLKELVNSGLISQQRSGRNLIYRADFQRMNDLLGYLTENCCQGEKCDEPAKTACASG
jgi:ArsR family transcriptional regulator, arsenate/arsenite/antimonite-responsive transcriptional repressor